MTSNVITELRLRELDDLIDSIGSDGDIELSDQFQPETTNAIVLAKVLKSFAILRKAVRDTLQSEPRDVRLVVADCKVDEIFGCEDD